MNFIQGNLGIFHITDIRIIWHAELNENFNVSVPYYQTKSVKIRESKFGLALVVETTPYVSEKALFFQVDLLLIEWQLSPWISISTGRETTRSSQGNLHSS